ncbi:hypothetical protein POM88_030251 [Heracleum sosnowskyi]|uniref:Uncharacterized protein n=1 Tax=Heracleum sosnowskyi TaxID=360622 RepID=A0AAD8MJ77_9APIA|nr:hypothetical protein POM88_030251 [Heracleum sosnowskyi]
MNYEKYLAYYNRSLPKFSISCYDGLESGNAVALTEIVFRELNEANNLMESDCNNLKVCNIFRLLASTYRRLVLIKRPIIFISQSSQARYYDTRSEYYCSME